MFSIDTAVVATSVQGLASVVRHRLESIAVQAQQKWYPQHYTNGAHTAVTATSLDSTGLVTFPRFGFRPTPFTYGSGVPRGIVVSPDIGGTTVNSIWHFPNVDTAGVIIPDLSGGSAAIYGLSTLNRQVGDVVALVNHQGYNADLGLRLNATGLSDGKFAGNLSTPNVDVTLPRGRWVWLMLLAMPGATSLRWHVSHF